jgi:hypothetical protein
MGGFRGSQFGASTTGEAASLPRLLIVSNRRFALAKE